MSTPTNVIVVSDAGEFHRRTKEHLAQEGCECHSASHADAARALVGHPPHDAVVMHLAEADNSQLHAVVVTSDLDHELASRLLQGPVIAFLKDPADPNDLLAGVTRSASASRAYRAAAHGRQRHQECGDALSKLLQSMAISPRSTLEMSLEAYFGLTFQNIVAGLADLQHVTDVLAGHGEAEGACHLFDCPKVDALTDALVETVAVLEKSKSAFRSKELGQLRKRLTSLMRGGRDEDRQR